MRAGPPRAGLLSLSERSRRRIQLRRPRRRQRQRSVGCRRRLLPLHQLLPPLLEGRRARNVRRRRRPRLAPCASCGECVGLIVPGAQLRAPGSFLRLARDAMRPIRPNLQATRPPGDVALRSRCPHAPQAQAGGEGGWPRHRNGPAGAGSGGSIQIVHSVPNGSGHPYTHTIHILQPANPRRRERPKGPVLSDRRSTDLVI